MSGHLEAELIRYGYVFVFLGTLVEGDATLVTAGFLAHRGFLSLPGVITVAVIATTALNQVFFRLARSRSYARFEKAAMRHPRYAKIREWVRRRGTLLLLFSRFIFGLRLAIPAACGVAGMKPAWFFLINLAGALLWALPLTLVAYGLGNMLDRLSHRVHAYEGWLALALAAGAGAFLAFGRRDFRTAKLAFVHPDQLGPDAALRVVVETERRHHHSADTHKQEAA